MQQNVCTNLKNCTKNHLLNMIFGEMFGTIWHLNVVSFPRTSPFGASLCSDNPHQDPIEPKRCEEQKAEHELPSSCQQLLLGTFFHDFLLSEMTTQAGVKAQFDSIAV